MFNNVSLNLLFLYRNNLFAKLNLCLNLYRHFLRNIFFFSIKLNFVSKILIIYTIYFFKMSN